MRHTSTTANWD